jgi:hypothetical protein
MRASRATFLPHSPKFRAIITIMDGVAGHSCESRTVAARRPRRIKGDNNIVVPPSRRRRPAIIAPKVDEFPRPAWNSRGNVGSRT